MATRTVLVTGCSGTIGSGIIKTLLEKSFRVVTFSRNAESLEAVRERLGRPANDRLIMLQGSLATDKDAEKLKQDVLSKVDGLTDVVSSLGSWWQKGPILDQTLEEYHKVQSNVLEPHFVLAKTFLPLVYDKEGSTYTFITGGTGHQYVPNAGLVTLFVSGLFKLPYILHQEYKDKPVRINDFCICEVIREWDKTKPGEISNIDIGLGVHAVMTIPAANGIQLTVTKTSLPTIQQKGTDQ